MKKIFSALLVALCLSGCLTDQDLTQNQHKREKVGTVAGAVSGAALGTYLMAPTGSNGAIFGAIAGGLLGGAIGNRTGKYLDEKARAKMMQTNFYALNHGQTGQVYGWSEGDYSGSFIPQRDFYMNDSHFQRELYCREFSQTVNIGGKQERAFGKACRMPDGAWKIIG